MKILLTNHHLREYTGTEVSTYTLAKFLKIYEHEVFVYAKYLSKRLISDFKKIGVDTYDDLKLLKNKSFDLAHVQHNICAYEVRCFFPKLPMLMWVHGSTPFLEQPPVIDLKIDLFMANNHFVADHVRKHFSYANQLIIFRNIVDSEVFFTTNSINHKPKHALVLSNRIDIKKEKIIKEVLDDLKISATFIGKRFLMVPNTDLPKYINQADLVFSIGLGAIEAMFCGRVPILFDNNQTPYDDGLVTNQNFEKLMEVNFSGKALKTVILKEDLLAAIRNYDIADAKKIRIKALEYYSADRQIKKLLKIYQAVIDNHIVQPLEKEGQMILNQVVKMIEETKNYSIDNTMRFLT